MEINESKDLISSKENAISINDIVTKMIDAYKSGEIDDSKEFFFSLIDGQEYPCIYVDYDDLKISFSKNINIYKSVLTDFSWKDEFGAVKFLEDISMSKEQLFSLPFINKSSCPKELQEIVNRKPKIENNLLNKESDENNISGLPGETANGLDRVRDIKNEEIPLILYTKLMRMAYKKKKVLAKKYLKFFNKYCSIISDDIIFDYSGCTYSRDRKYLEIECDLYINLYNNHNGETKHVNKLDSIDNFNIKVSRSGDEYFIDSRINYALFPFYDDLREKLIELFKYYYEFDRITDIDLEDVLLYNDWHYKVCADLSCDITEITEYTEKLDRDIYKYVTYHNKFIGLKNNCDKDSNGSGNYFNNYLRKENREYVKKTNIPGRKFKDASDDFIEGISKLMNYYGDNYNYDTMLVFQSQADDYFDKIYFPNQNDEIKPSVPEKVKKIDSRY